MNKVHKLLHHFFVPKETNNYRAKALHLDALTVYLVMALLITVGVKNLASHQGKVLGFATDITVDKLYQLTNQERSKAGLSTLTYNDKLANAAAGKAADMFAKNYWAHFGPNGETPWEFITGAGYNYKYAGENLARDFSFSDGVVDAWMNSPSHRENMLRPVYTDVGFAVVNGTLDGEPTTLVVQMFGTPLNAPVQADTTKVQPTAVPTLAPTAVPTLVPTTVPSVEPSAAVQAVQSEQLPRAAGKPMINLFPVLYNVNLIFLVVMALAIVLDFYYASRIKVARVQGKSLAHLIFIIFMLLAMLIVTQGATL